MERVKNSRTLRNVFDAILGLISLAVVVFVSNYLDWPINALASLLIIVSTVLVIIQNRQADRQKDEAREIERNAESIQ